MGSLIDHGSVLLVFNLNEGKDHNSTRRIIQKQAIIFQINEI